MPKAENMRSIVLGSRSKISRDTGMPNRAE